MNLEITVAEVRELINSVRKPEELFDLIRFDVKGETGAYLSKLMEAELTSQLGRERYERGGEENNHRNGSYTRRMLLKGIGEVEVRVPRDRLNNYQTEVLPRCKRYEQVIAEDLSLMFLTGISTRCLSLISDRLVGRKISHTEISSASKELEDSVENWRRRDLSKDKIKYLILDGVNFRMRVNGRIELVNVLVAIGVAEDGGRMVLGLQAGDKESAGTWREFFKDLKARGLDGASVKLGIMDGLAGLEKVFSEEFRAAKVQRCQVHVARNILVKFTKKNKREAADDVRSIFYASSKAKAREFAKDFREKWNKDFPSAVKCMENSLESCIAYLDFPEEEWISLRTTNMIERLNKEFKRRTKTMEIVAGELSCYRLLAFICLRMELHWRTKPVGKVKANLPFFDRISHN